MKINYLIAGAVLLCSSCGQKADSASDSDTASAPVADTATALSSEEKAQEDSALAAKEAEQNEEAEKQALEKRIREIWKQIPCLTNENAHPERVMTPEFKKLYSTANGNAENSGDMDLMEQASFCIDYQDPTPGAKIVWIKIDSIDGDNARATVKYSDRNVPQPHKLKLKRINGVWLLDDFDNLRKNCRQVINMTAA